MEIRFVALHLVEAGKGGARFLTSHIQLAWTGNGIHGLVFRLS